MEAKVKRDGTVEVGGRRVGRVEKRRERTTHMGGSGGLNYAVGFSYRTRWDAFDAKGAKVTGISGRELRRDAVEDLLAAVARDAELEATRVRSEDGRLIATLATCPTGWIVDRFFDGCSWGGKESAARRFVGRVFRSSIEAADAVRADYERTTRS